MLGLGDELETDEERRRRLQQIAQQRQMRSSSFSPAGTMLLGGGTMLGGGLPRVFGTIALLAIILAPALARAYDLAPNATITTTAGGCTCAEAGKTWACRRFAYDLASCPLLLPWQVTCDTGRDAPCIFQRYCSGVPLALENICIAQDKPK